MDSERDQRIKLLENMGLIPRDQENSWKTPGHQLTFDDIDAILEEELTEVQKQRRRESGYYEG